MGVQYLPDFEKTTYFVYAMLCRDGNGPLYVKFGRSRKIGERLTALRTGSPIPAKWFAIIETPGRMTQAVVEKALHAEFKDRRTTGEWFRFESDSEEEKRAFNDGCAKVFTIELGQGHNWQKLSVSALDAYAAGRRRAYFLSKNRKKIDARHRAKLQREKAWKELDSYGQ